MGYILIALVLLIEIPRFYGAYSAVDNSLLPALGTGIVLPIGAGLVFHSWWKVDQKKTGRNMLLVWFFILMALEGLILVPWAVSQLREVPLASVLKSGVDWGWAIVVMMSPFIMVSAVVNGLALQRTTKTTKHSEVEPTTISVEKPTTREGFRDIYNAMNPEDKKQLTGKKVIDLVGVPICEKTGTNWINYARGNNGAKRIAD